ncbi:MAG: TRAPP I complex [Lasallia pustulata]|uniref:Trafficking protein particle complex subunit n=1 Tax=Lasallia pustulata TaxID=136370 RepID=A0A5M8PI03_9LECA|nr:MAG: TRAPP I complex [Lasallia pustulata]
MSITANPIPNSSNPLHLPPAPPTTLQPSPQQQHPPGPTPPPPPPGLRTPSNRKTIYDRHLNRTRTSELSRASFAYLFSEIVTYAQRRVTGIQDLERRLSAQASPLGPRLLPLLLYRSPPRSTPRPHRILALLTFITQPLWRHLFARPADSLEKSTANDNEYMIADNEPLVNTYVSVPKEMSQLNCAAFVAGVLEGVCEAAGLGAQVTAHNAGTELWPGRTVFLVRFEGGVVEREGAVERGR